MKKVFILSLFVFGGILMSAQKLTLQGLNEDSLEYGSIEKDSEGERTIVVKNTGRKPLIITNVTSSCGCTVPDWSKEPIKRGKKGFVKVKYNTSIVGQINKAITINSNDIETPNKIVKIKGNVEDKKSETPIN